jgi:hypothetical protein
LFTKILNLRAKRQKPEVQPRLEQLDQRAVPAMMGLGFGGLAVPSYGSSLGGFGAPAFSVLGNNTYGFNTGFGAYNRFGAYNSPFNAFNRPFGVFNHPYLAYNTGVFSGSNPYSAFGLTPGGFISTTTTPSGPVGFNGTGFGRLGFGGLSYTSAGTFNNFTPNGTATSPFNLGTGGFISTTMTPSGPMGLNTFNVRF